MYACFRGGNASFLTRSAVLRVRKGLAEIHRTVQLTGFENLTAVQALKILRIVVLGDQSFLGVLAGWIRHGRLSSQAGSYHRLHANT